MGRVALVEVASVAQDFQLRSGIIIESHCTPNVHILLVSHELRCKDVKTGHY